MTFTACEEDLLDVNFDMDGGDITFVVSKEDVVNSNGQPVVVTTPRQSTSGEELGANKTSLDKLKSAKVKSCVVTITAPAGEDFSFVNEVKFSLSGQGIPMTLVASKSDIDATATSVTLDVEDVELVEFLQSGEVSSEISFTTDETIDEDITMKAVITYAVTAGL